jgi:hypothetical protein
MASCNTVSSVRTDYAEFDAETVRQVAEEIESAVRAGNRTPELQDRGVVVVNTARIKQAVRSRAARVEILNEFKATGYAFEKSNGLVAIRRTKEYKKSTTWRGRDRNALLVGTGENPDRWNIYEGIIEASKFKPKTLEQIQSIFHSIHVAHLPTGHAYEDENGDTVVK